MMSRGRHDEAIPVLKDIVAANPADQDARIALAVTLLGTGDLASAALENRRAARLLAGQG
jgi:Flp pilus assembly protein TadD